MNRGNRLLRLLFGARIQPEGPTAEEVRRTGDEELKTEDEYLRWLEDNARFIIRRERKR